MSYIGTEPKDIRSFGRTKFDYTASQGQTAFTGADDDGKVLAFTTGQINVYVNGILMDDSDFTTTGTGTVTLASAANLNDVVNVVSFETNIPDSDYVPAGTGGTFAGAVTASNGLTVDDSAATPLTVDRSGAVGSIIDVQKDGSTVGQISNIGNDFVVGSSTGSGAGLRFDGTNNMMYASNSLGSSRDDAVSLGGSSVRFKDLYLSGGVYIGGTVAANYLTDYEHGSGNASITGSGGGTITTAGDKTYYYTKIGNLVHFQIEFTLTGISGCSGATQIALPFQSKDYVAGSLRAYSATYTGNSLFCEAHPAGTQVLLKSQSSGNASHDVLSSTTSYYFVTLTYIAN